MREVLRFIETRTKAFESAPFFRFLADDAVAPGTRMAFAPCIGHYIMTFGDLCVLLREEPTDNELQAMVNTHTHEDTGHWEWYLADLAALGRDPQLRFTEALRFLWSDAGAKTRMLGYRLCSLGIGASPARKLVLLHALEATFKTSLAASGPAVAALARQGVELAFFGGVHAGAESAHAMDEAAAAEKLDRLELPAAERVELFALVDQVFAAFTDFTDELLAFAKSGAPMART